MEVMLGVSVDGGRGQIALLDASDGHAVIDRADVEGAGAPQSVLVARVIATHRELAAAGHRLVATRLCSADADLAGRLVEDLDTAGLSNVAAVAPGEAGAVGGADLALGAALTGAIGSQAIAEATAATGLAPVVDPEATGWAPAATSETGAVSAVDP
ncbi:MAG TPA: hypothetical protein PLF91_13435, partial [Mycolicibacterium fallax]|nr:hypothetical protein [Mycolicibacterium fallax]